MTTRRAFTLLEVLVVLAIVALVAAILTPSLAKTRRLARRMECMTNLHGMGIGVDGYSSTYNGILPWEGYAEGDRPIRHVGRWEDSSQWFNAIPEFAGYPTYSEMQEKDRLRQNPLPKDGDKSILVCTESNPAEPGPEDDLVQDGYFMLWGLEITGQRLDRRKTYWSFGYNTELDAGVEDRHLHKQVYLTSIKRASETAILSEKIMSPNEYEPPFLSSVGQSAVSWKEFTTRHDGGGGILFLDSHVEYFKRSELVNAPHAPSDFNQPGKVIWNPGGPAN